MSWAAVVLAIVDYALVKIEFKHKL